jgi:hypothetical protein
MGAWCPRCQRQVRVRTREVADAKKREKRVERLCAECGILLSARTERESADPSG